MRESCTSGSERGKPRKGLTYLPDNIRSYLIGIRRKIFKQDILFREEKSFSGSGKELADMAFDDHPVKKGECAIDFIFILF